MYLSCTEEKKKRDCTLFALGKSLTKFVFFAVEICYRGPLPSATPLRFFALAKTLRIGKTSKTTCLGGAGRCAIEKSSQTMGITAVTVNARQCNM